MRKIIVATAAVLAVFAFVCAPFRAIDARAVEQGYVRVELETVYLMRRPVNVSGERLFVALSGYYLRVTGENSLYYQVVIYDNYDGYYSVTAYVRKDLVTTEANPVLPLYPKAAATVIVNSCFIYALPDASSEVVMTALLMQEVCYYGVLDNYLYCRLGNAFGYIAIENVLLPDIPAHPKPLSTPVSSEPKPATGNKGENDSDSPSNLLPLVLTCASLVLVVACGAFAMRKYGKNKG